SSQRQIDSARCCKTAPTVAIPAPRPPGCRHAPDVCGQTVTPPDMPLSPMPPRPSAPTSLVKETCLDAQQTSAPTPTRRVPFVCTRRSERLCALRSLPDRFVQRRKQCPPLRRTNRPDG